MFARQFYKLVPNLLPEIWKKKTISYLLKRYLGHFLSESVTLEQLTVDLGQGKGSIRDLNLDVEAISGLLEDVPVEIIDGFIQSIELAVPWSSLLKESTTVEIHGLELTIRPKQVQGTAAFLDTMSMLNSMSMSSSLQLARECLESEKPPKPPESPTEEQSPFEGVQMFAQTIESVLSRVKVTLINTVIRLEYVDPNTGLGVGLEIKIERMEYFDDQAVSEDQSAMTADKQQGQEADWQPAILIKNFHAMGTTITLDTFNHNTQDLLSGGPDSLGNSPNMYISTLSTLHSSHHHPYRNESEEEGEGDTAGPPILPIPIAVLVGKSMMKVKVKQKVSLEGPKLGLDCQFGALHSLLSPQQLHALLHLVSGFAQPTSGSARSGKGRTTLNRPMDSADFERVEQELQRHLQAERLKRQGVDIRRAQDDPLVNVLVGMEVSEELYFSMCSPQAKHPSSVMESSLTSVGTADTASTQATSTFPHSEMGSIPKTSTRQSAKHKVRAVNDPSAEISHYYVKVGMVSVCLLHEDPKPDYHRGEKSSYTDRMKTLANEFFRNVRVINFMGHNLSLRDIRDKVSAALPLDHIGLLSKPLSLECVERTLRKNHSYSVDVTLHAAELVECLFDRRERDPGSVSFTADTDVKLPQYSELLTFPSQDSAEQTPHGSLYTVTPAAKIRLSVVSRNELYGETTSETKVSVELGPLSSEVDITIIDRLTGLLYPSTPQYAATQSGVFAQTTGTAAGPHCFDQAMEDGSSAKDGVIDASITCSQASLRIRFPVPDLHPSSQLAPRQWWRRDLHKEQLLLELQSLRFHTGTAQSGTSVFELTCSQIEAYFQEDFNQTPILFGRITGDDSVDAQEAEEGFNWPRVVVKTFPHSTGALDAGEDSDDSTPNNSLNGACQFSAPEPSPFSSRKSMYDREDMYHGSPEDGTAQPDTQETVIPGDKREMHIFQESASARTQLLVEITVPVVTALIHDKPFFELLYNRVNNDLLMWEPQAPSPSFSPESIPSGLGIHLSVQHLLSANMAEHSELFEQQSSQYESDSDSDDAAPYYSIHDTRRGGHREARQRLQSKLCLSLNIGEGKLLACVPHKEDGCHGELFVVLKDATLYSVTAHGGDPDLRCLCFQANRASLYHGPCVKQPVMPGRLDGIADNTPLHLKHRIYRSERGVPTGGIGLVGTGADNSQDMISVAVKTKIDTINNTKHFTVSLAVQGGTLRHEMSLDGESWISQVIEFLDVKDYPIKGYTMPTVLTELHVHLKGCAVDYRPVHLPIKTVLTADNFSVSSNITANSNSTSLRFLLEEAALYLSDKKYMEVNLKKDYVSVAHLAMFELCARLGDGKEPGWPKTDMRVQANKMELRTCADSCRALVDLIMYFARDGDLDPKLSSTSEDGDSLSSQSTPRQGSEERRRSEESLSESRLDYLHSMMEDAIRESSTSTSDSDSPEKTQPGTAVFFMTEDHFNQSPRSAPPAGLRQIVFSPSSESVTSSMLSQEGDGSDIEDDFCIIDDPGIGIAPRDGEPKIRVFTKEPIALIDDFFSKPLGKIDHLKAPQGYPKPDRRYTVRELTLTWHMYGGQDFGKDRGREPEKSKPEKSHAEKYLPAFGSPSHSADRQKRSRTWQDQGGPQRNHNVLMEVCLSKIGLQFEEYPPNINKAMRWVFLVHDAEVRDRLKASHINKFLYQDTSEKRPRQSSANMLCMKALFTRPDPKVPTRECSLHISGLPIRLNIDQESLFFLRQFVMEFTGQQPSDPYTPTPGGEGFRPGTPTLSSSGGSGSRDRGPVLGLDVAPEEEEREEGGRPRSDLLIQLDEISLERSQALKATLEEEGSDTSSNYDDLPVFFRSVVFSPALPIRLDYSGKCLDMDRTLAGLLIGLAQLNNSELCLKRISHKQGLLGAEKVVAFLLNEWLTDIRANQLPSILGGVGPMHSFVQLAQGIRDMFWMPVEQYRRDGRVWRGMQRGASSLTMSTARAVIELTNKAVSTIQYVSELTYDMLSPGPSVRQPQRQGNARRRLQRRQPTDLREGVTNAYHVISEGISDTAQQLIRAATEEQEQKGMTGVVGGVLRQIPPTAVKPLIIASSATSNVLGGMRNQLCPAARKEDEDKWKGDN